MKPPSFPKAVLWVLFLGIILPLAGGVVLDISLKHTPWFYSPFHSIVEGGGVFTASALAFLILLSKEHRTNPVYGVWSLCALLGMGVFDLFHSVGNAGNNFVWLRSLSVLAGGLFLSLTWVPSRFIPPRTAQWLPRLVVLMAVGMVFLSFRLPETVPLMVSGRNFSITAQGLNTAGGFLFFAAAVRFMTLYRARPDWLDLVMAGLCALSGASGILFDYSDLWCPLWWWWHCLRLFAYFIVVWFIVLFYQRVMEELERANVKLERSNKELEQFAYVASHDLQEPLRMVTSYVQLLAKRYQGRLDADADTFIGFAVDGAKRMQNLINDLLAFSRVGTRAKEFALTDCEKVLDTALQNLQPTIVENHAEITRDPLPKVTADEGQLVQVFQNLIANAIKFRQKGITPRIHISCRGEGKVFIFSVADNGIGIAPEHYEKIFQIFQRLHPRDEYEGSGIGLAVCKKIVERHGGRIGVESETGKGTAFNFSLPAV